MFKIQQQVELDSKIDSYPSIFKNRLKKNWNQISELMHFEGELLNIDSVKNLTDFVKTIQEILIKEGIILKFGKDGKFGSETEKYLNEVLKQRAFKERRKDEDISFDLTNPVDDNSENAEDLSKIFNSESETMNILNEAGLTFETEKLGLKTVNLRVVNLYISLLKKNPEILPVIQIIKKITFNILKKYQILI